MGKLSKEHHPIKGDEPSFSVIDDPWIPVLFMDGSHENLSIRDVFHQAPHIQAVVPEFPQEELPLLRLLIAVLYRAFAHTDENGQTIDEWGVDELDDHYVLDLWFAIYKSGHFPLQVVDEYLDSIPGKADLFDPHQPFFQTPALQYAKAGKQTPIYEHLPDVPDKEGKFLFSTRSKNSLGPVSFAEAARILVFLQAYDVSGIHSAVQGSKTAKKGKEYAPKGLIGTGYLGAIGGLFNEASNLFNTLMLNWVLIGPDSSGLDRCILGMRNDLAPWDTSYDVNQTQMVSDHVCTGPVDALTWQTRRLRLLISPDKSSVSGLVITYGNVAQVLNANTTEMMTAWRESKQQLKRHPELPYALMPVLHDPDTYLWQGLPNLLGQVEKSDTSGNSLAPGIVQWVNRLQSSGSDYWPLDSEKAKGMAQEQELPNIISLHSQGIVYGAQSAVIETGVDDSIQLDSRILNLGSDVTNLVVSTVQNARQCIDYYRTFLQDLAIARGDDAVNARNHIDSSLEPVYVTLDQVFRRHLRFINPSKVPLTRVERQWQDDIHRTLLHAARNELHRAPAPAFGEHTFTTGKLKGEVATSARAMSILANRLTKALGRFASDPQKTVRVND